MSIRPTLDERHLGWIHWRRRQNGHRLQGLRQDFHAPRAASRSEDITAKFEKHFKNIAPESVKLKVTAMHGASPR